MAYSQFEPFGEDGAYWRTGLLAAMYHNAHREENSQPMKPEDYMPSKPVSKETRLIALKCAAQQLFSAAEAQGHTHEVK